MWKKQAMLALLICLTVVLLIAISLPLAWLLKRLTNLIMDN